MGGSKGQVHVLYFPYSKGASAMQIVVVIYMCEIPNCHNSITNCFQTNIALERCLEINTALDYMPYAVYLSLDMLYFPCKFTQSFKYNIQAI